MEAIGAAIPEMPDKRTVVEDLRMLLKELVPQPIFECFGFAAPESSGSDHSPFIEGAQRSGEKLPKSSGSRLLTVERRKADNAVLIRKHFQTVWSQRGAIRKVAASLARPAITQQPSN